ncbi:hypothetical protein [Aquimarina sp. 2201CG14-23]|uniref:hypothetical protein n=1 Tax=Aquimarina mycalae TaxID=3040073 RepID=UPI002477F2D4|nr:hypothetical protein [Aquimarina sp. 2201CG14-23]MDH7446675.1 hypothetical protein [Aquimarina sp. 2201CG14-23]
MRTLIVLIASLIFSLSAIKAQTTETKSTKSSSEFSMLYDSDSPNKKYYRSFTVLDMDDDYRIKVRFMKSLKSNVKSYLVSQFGEEKMKIKEDTFLWVEMVDEEEMYEIKLKGNKLRINVSKELASDKLIKRFKQVGEELKKITSKSEEI